MLNCFSLPVSNKTLHKLCTACQLGKSSKLTLSISPFKSKHVLDLIYSDVWGPAPCLSSGGHRYFVLFVDDYSRYMWVYPMARKSDMFILFKQFITMVERQFSSKVKTVQTDWGGEYRNLSNYFSTMGIVHRLSCPHTHEQNGYVERRNRHVVETGLTLLAQGNVPHRFWHYAFDTAVFLINRMPSRVSQSVSPYEHLFKKQPDYYFLKVFGVNVSRSFDFTMLTNSIFALHRVFS